MVAMGASAAVCNSHQRANATQEVTASRSSTNSRAAAKQAICVRGKLQQNQKSSAAELQQQHQGRDGRKCSSKKGLQQHPF
jgi:hypothetical protein